MRLRQKRRLGLIDQFFVQFVGRRLQLEMVLHEFDQVRAANVKLPGGARQIAAVLGQGFADGVARGLEAVVVFGRVRNVAAAGDPRHLVDDILLLLAHQLGAFVKSRHLRRLGHRLRLGHFQWLAIAAFAAERLEDGADAPAGAGEHRVGKPRLGVVVPLLLQVADHNLQLGSGRDEIGQVGARRAAALGGPTQIALRLHEGLANVAFIEACHRIVPRFEWGRHSCLPSQRQTRMSAPRWFRVSIGLLSRT